MQYEECLSRYRDEKKEAVVLQAAQLFLQKGIEPVKMTDIAQQCGIGVASLYRYFGTKTSIVIAAGCLLWQDVRKMFEGVYACQSFLSKSGKEQIRDLLRLVPVLFSSQKEFLRFLGEFDSFVSAHKVSPSELDQYEKNVLDCYPVFQKSWAIGLRDGTIRADLDGQQIYITATHALMAMSQKFLKGNILPSDDFSAAENELEMLVEMTLLYIST